MSNKKMIKKVFEDEFDKTAMKRQILSNYEKKEGYYMSRTLKLAIPVCLITLICGTLIFNGEKEKFSQPEVANENVKIFVNKVEQQESTKLDVDMRIDSFEVKDTWINTLKSDIAIPEDLNKKDEYSIYTRKDKKGEYDILNSHVLEFYKDDAIRQIRIAFSQNGKPARDYFFDEESAKKSYINNFELKIYQYGETYFTTFNYEDYNFDIETQNITLEELTELLTSIVKE